jgi:hypothetical protein
MSKSAIFKTGLSKKTVGDHLEGYDVYDAHHDYYAHIRVGGEGVCLVAAL